jgi:hypothetical protein
MILSGTTSSVRSSRFAVAVLSFVVSAVTNAPRGN